MSEIKFEIDCSTLPINQNKNQKWQISQLTQQLSWSEIY
jgi:hypothetical protein